MKGCLRAIQSEKELERGDNSEEENEIIVLERQEDMRKVEVKGKEKECWGKNAAILLVS